MHDDDLRCLLLPLTCDQLVVVGDQSSGKSSVLEALTGLPFPRDSTLCTRFPTQIVFKRSPDRHVDVSIIPGAGSEQQRDDVLQHFATAMSRRNSELESDELLDILQKAGESHDSFICIVKLTSVGLAHHGSYKQRQG